MNTHCLNICSGTRVPSNRAYQTFFFFFVCTLITRTFLDDVWQGRNPGGHDNRDSRTGRHREDAVMPHDGLSGLSASTRRWARRRHGGRVLGYGAQGKGDLHALKST